MKLFGVLQNVSGYSRMSGIFGMQHWTYYFHTKSSPDIAAWGWQLDATFAATQICNTSLSSQNISWAGLDQLFCKLKINYTKYKCMYSLITAAPVAVLKSGYAVVKQQSEQLHSSEDNLKTTNLWTKGHTTTKLSLIQVQQTSKSHGSVNKDVEIQCYLWVGCR